MRVTRCLLLVSVSVPLSFVSASAFAESACKDLVGKSFFALEGTPTLSFAEKRQDGIYLNQTIAVGQRFRVTDIKIGVNTDNDVVVLTEDGRTLNVLCADFTQAMMEQDYSGQRVIQSDAKDYRQLLADQERARADAERAQADEQKRQQSLLAGQERARAEEERRLQADQERAQKKKLQATRRREAQREEQLRQYVAQRMARGGVRIGMTEQQALSSSWGEPDKRNHTLTGKGDSEQWVYADGQYFLYFTNGSLTGIQTDSPDEGYFRVAH